LELGIKGKTKIKKVTKLGMIAGGSGIAPMFQIIQKVNNLKNDNTALSLIYGTKHIVII
jgi:NAD(P)H-flavin reductase